MKVAAIAYPVTAPADFDAFAAKQRAIVGVAAREGAEIVVLPEYLSLELGATHPPAIASDLHRSLAAIQSDHDRYLALFADVAREHRTTIAAGTFLVDVGNGRYRNRAYLVSPDGGIGFQDKLQLTGFEKAASVIEAGDALRCFEAHGTVLGVSVCYDSEFPLTVRAQREAGADLLLVPSCTDTAAGATRVAISCLARALENRFFVVKSVTAGNAPWSPALDENSGDAAIYAPMDRGFPDDGIVVTTKPGELLAIASLDPAALEASRANAQVSNDRDWVAQGRASIARAARVPLGRG